MHSLARILFLSASLLPLPGWAAGPIGTTLSTLHLQTLDGKDFSAAWNGAKTQQGILLVNFWASWCSYCQTEMPVLQSYYNKHQRDGLRLIGISIDDVSDLEKVRAIMQHFNYPAAMAQSNDAVRQFGRIWRVPMTYVVDKHGRVLCDLNADYQELNEALLEQQLAPLLQGKASECQAGTH